MLSTLRQAVPAGTFALYGERACGSPWAPGSRFLDLDLIVLI